MRFVLFFTIFFCHSLQNFAQDTTIIRVRTDGTGDAINGKGESWNIVDAFGNFQDAIEFGKLHTPSEIWVAKGTYYPDEWPSGSYTGDSLRFHFSLYDGISIYGGFFGDETSKHERNINENTTILSGNVTNSDIQPLFDANGYLIAPYGYYKNLLSLFINTDIISQSVIDGFTISGCRSDQYTGFFRNTRCNLRIENCIFENNLGDNNSNAGIFFNDCQVEMSNVRFSNSYAREICYFRESDVRLNHVIFNHNWSNLRLSLSTFIFDNLQFNKNKVQIEISSSAGTFKNMDVRENAGRILHITNKSDIEINSLRVDNTLWDLAGWIDKSKITISNSYFGNNHGDNGGALQISNSDYILENTIFKSNAASISAGGVYLYYSNGEISQCTFLNNVRGGLRVVGGEQYLQNSHFVANQGTAFSTHNAHNTVINCLFAHNESGASILSTKHLSTTNFINCTMVNNFPSENQINCDADSYVNLYNSILWNSGDTTLFNKFFNNIRLENSAIYSGTPKIDTLFNLDQDNFAPNGPGFIRPTYFSGYPQDEEAFNQVLNANWNLHCRSILMDQSSNEVQLEDTIINLDGMDIQMNSRSLDGDLDGIAIPDLGSFEFSYPNEVSLPQISYDVQGSTIYNFNDQIEYSFNSNDGFDGTWQRSDSTDFHVIFPLVPEGYNFYIRQIEHGCNSTWIKRFSQASAPLFDIDYLNEITRQEVSDKIEYAINSYNSFDFIGKNTPVQVMPDTIAAINFRKRATKDELPSRVFSLLVPGRPMIQKVKFDDNLDRIEWIYTPTLDQPSDYEFSINGGYEWQDCYTNPTYIGNVAIDSGLLVLRIKSSNEAGRERFSGQPVFSEIPFSIITSFRDNANQTLSIFPNPTLHFLNFNNVALPNNQQASVNILNSHGRVLAGYTIESNMHSIDVSSLAPGVYIVVLTHLNDQYFFKMNKL